MKLEVTINGKQYNYRRPVLGVPSKAQRFKAESDTLVNIEQAYGNRMTEDEFNQRDGELTKRIAQLEAIELNEAGKAEITALNESRQELMKARLDGDQVATDWWTMVNIIIQDPTDDLRLEKLAETMTEGDLQSVLAGFFILRTEDIREASDVFKKRSMSST